MDKLISCHMIYGWWMLIIWYEICIRNHIPIIIIAIPSRKLPPFSSFPLPEPKVPTGPHRAPPTHDLTTEMEGVAEARLLALLGGQGLHRLQVEVVVQVQEVQVLAWKKKKHRLYEWADVPTVFLYNQQRTYFCAFQGSNTTSESS